MLMTLLHRPYVFLFLLAFLVLGKIYWGWKKTIIWLVIGYVIAWASEFSSIHNGFPYGLYHYIYENMRGELMVFGVPFWDSLSYPFMIFAGYATAEFILGMSLRGVKRRSNLPNALEPGGLPRRSTQRIECSARNDIPAAFLGAILTMLLDIIIDPLTVLGDKWFLGKVYYYPNGGQYFGVPLTNFAGWFLVPLMVIIVFQLVMSFPYYSCHPRESGDPVNTRDSRLRGNDTAALTHQRTPPLLPRRAGNALTHFFNPLFYLAIALFNIAITMWIGETLLASIDCMLLAPVIGLLIWRIKSSLITSH